MSPVCAGQIKAARALLDWSQGDLARASGLSITTIRCLETGHVSPRSASEVCKVIENAGLEFTEGEGVRRRDDKVRIYQGPDSCDRLFEDMLQTLKARGGDIIAVVKSQNILTQPCGMDRRTNLQRLQSLEDLADIKCLLSDAIMPSFSVPSFEFRTTSKYAVGPSSCFVYGDKYAYAVPDGRRNFLIVIFDIATAALDNQKHFLSLWENALPLRVQTDPQEERARI